MENKQDWLENQPWMKMYFLFNMGILCCHVTFLGDTFGNYPAIFRNWYCKETSYQSYNTYDGIFRCRIAGKNCSQKMTSRATDLCCPAGFSSIPLCCWTLPAFRRPFDNVALIVYLATSRWCFFNEKNRSKVLPSLIIWEGGRVRELPSLLKLTVPVCSQPSDFQAFAVCLLFVSGRVQDLQISKRTTKKCWCHTMPTSKREDFQHGVPWVGSSHLSPATRGQKGEGDMGRKGKQQPLHSKLPIEGFWNSAAYLDWLEVVGKSFKKYVPKW